MTAPFDLSQTDKLLTTTRSVRKRLDLELPVPREVVLECLGIALQAPSGGNSQPWRWLIVDDADTRKRLAALYQRSHDPYMAANREAVEAGGRADVMGKIMDSSQYLSDHMGEVPVMVCWAGPRASAKARSRASTARSCRRCGASCSPFAAGAWGRPGRRCT